jgi:hypothetical protein
MCQEALELDKAKQLPNPMQFKLFFFPWWKEESYSSVYKETFDDYVSWQSSGTSSIGQSCNSDDDCDNGLFCDPSTSLCATNLTAGEVVQQMQVYN